ncbi:MAG: cation:proton antiporter [Gemmatimonadaceae bacterium]|jgi:NhaP-type Na+/H+ or K+/H+ antiporter
MAYTLLGIGLLYFFAHLLAITFDRTRLPDVLVLMMIGILVGPILGWTGPEAFGTSGRALATIALAVILFESGTTLDLSQIQRSARSTLQLAIVTAGMTIGVIALGAHYFLGLSWIAALLVGTIASGTSSAVVIPMVRSLRMREGPGTLLILESALTDVTSIVLTFAMLQAATQGEVHVGRLIGQTISSLSFAAVIGIAGGVGWLLIWDRIRQLPTTVFTTLAGAFILYGTAELLGFAGAIAVLAFGITLTNYPYLQLARRREARPLTGVTPAESDFYREIVFLLKTFFFVYLGLSMRLDNLAILGIALVLMLAVYAGRLLITALLAPQGSTRDDAVILGVMIPKGLAAAVLAALPLETGMPEGSTIQALVYGIVLMSIILTALLVALRSAFPIKQILQRPMGQLPEA